MKVKSDFGCIVGVLDDGKADQDDDGDDGIVSTEGDMYHQRAPDRQPIIIQMVLLVTDSDALGTHHSFTSSSFI